MKPFRFSLQAVRVLRQRQEYLALERYAKALQARQEALCELQKTQQQLEAVWIEWRQRFSKGPTAVELDHLQAYSAAMAQREKECAVQMHSAQRGVNLAWQNLIAARQQLEAVDHHYQNERRRHAQAQQREEQKLLDDMANRRSPGSGPTRGATETLWN